MSAFVLSACRSPVVPRDGALAALSVEALAASVLRATLEQASIGPDQVDEVIVSNALGAGGNPARRVALAAGLPERVAGLSIDRQCAGGMDALLLARQMVMSGDADVIVAGGVESYSRRPLRSQTFADGRAPQPYNQAPFTPWPDRDPEMSAAADALGKRLGIDRGQQDDWAVQSHAKARATVADRSEVVPLNGVERDVFTRRLSPALCARAKVITGDITAANAAVAADGAAFCVVVSERFWRKSGRPAVRVAAGATVGSDPTCPGLAPVDAIAETLERAGLSAADLCVVEVMEAYAVQAIACVQCAGIDPGIVNLSGGALARGHPIGASGAINATRLFHEVQRSGARGLATIAAAGGIGTALILEAG